jgi:hypothetical protein
VVLGVNVGCIVFCATLSSVLCISNAITAGYKEYVDLIGGTIGVGACGAGNQIHVIKDNTPLVHFLSEGGEEDGNDWLYIVIADIINAHNDMVELPKRLASPAYLRLLPQQQAKAYPGEVTGADCIVPEFKKLHQISDLLQLFRSRQRNLHPFPASSSKLQQAVTSVPLFNINELQEDIVTCFVAGKPFIHDMLRISFIFKVTGPKVAFHQACVISSDELTVIESKLSEPLKINMEKEYYKRLEFEFHASGYHIMQATTTGIRIAAGHLVQSVEYGDQNFNQGWNVAEFLLHLYDDHYSKKEVLTKIGMGELTATQAGTVLELPLANLYHCLKSFATWMENGMYDFSALPFSLKAHLWPTDSTIFKTLPDKWQGEVLLISLT